MVATPLGWIAIVRLGLVQTALGAIVVLTTSTLNRVMVVELAFPALLPGVLVGIHHALQMLRPRWGFGSDLGGQRTPWILGGMALLAGGGVTAAAATALMAHSTLGGIALAVLAFVAIGVGVGAAGTSLLVLLAKRVAAQRRAAAATLVWVMMIVGFIVTTAVAGAWLDPYSHTRLVAVTAGVAVAALAVSVAAVWGIEGGPAPSAQGEGAQPAFRRALSEVWEERDARHFTTFVFVSMLAYSMQDLILEPFAGTVFGFTPGQSTQLSSIQNGGVLAGMLVVGVLGTLRSRGSVGSLRWWTLAGCIASALALAGLVLASSNPTWPLRGNVFALGFANGAFAVAAIGSMMSMAAQGREQREGVRMGLWGAAQAIAFGAGGFVGAVASDVARWLLGSPVLAYAAVFTAEAALFVAAAWLASRIGLAGRQLPRLASASTEAAVLQFDHRV